MEEYGNTLGSRIESTAQVIAYVDILTTAGHKPWQKAEPWRKNVKDNGVPACLIWEKSRNTVGACVSLCNAMIKQCYLLT